MTWYKPPKHMPDGCWQGVARCHRPDQLVIGLRLDCSIWDWRPAADASFSEVKFELEHSVLSCEGNREVVGSQARYTYKGKFNFNSGQLVAQRKKMTFCNEVWQNLIDNGMNFAGLPTVSLELINHLSGFLSGSVDQDWGVFTLRQVIQCLHRRVRWHTKKTLETLKTFEIEKYSVPEPIVATEKSQETFETFETEKYSVPAPIVVRTALEPRKSPQPWAHAELEKEWLTVDAELRQRAPVKWYPIGTRVKVLGTRGHGQFWFQDGIVIDRVTETCDVDGVQVRAGSTKVWYNKGHSVKWVAPFRQQDLLGEFVPGETPPDVQPFVAVGTLFVVPPGRDGFEAYVEVKEGFLTWWDVDKQDPRPSGHVDLSQACVFHDDIVPIFKVYREHLDDMVLFSYNTNNPVRDWRWRLSWSHALSAQGGKFLHWHGKDEDGAYINREWEVTEVMQGGNIAVKTEVERLKAGRKKGAAYLNALAPRAPPRKAPPCST